jgi:FkbM family methyltransferase
MKTVDVFYVTYRHDLEWFQWSLHTVKQNLSGFRKIVAVAPEQDRDVFGCIEGVEWHFIPDWTGRGYFWQQWVKIQAWKYTGAEFICHIDSDVMVRESVSIDELFRADKPCWMWQFYTELTADVPWQPITQNLLGGGVAKEYMRAFPFILNRQTHQATEKFLVEKFKMSLEFILRTSSGFSEFNIMGAVAEKYHPELYTWFNTGKGGHWPQEFRRVRQYWSHDGVPHDELSKLARVVPMLTDFGVWVIPGDTHLSVWIREHRRLDFDTHFLEEICAFIKPGDTVVDVGAFVGDHSLAYANMTSGAPGRVLAFEPNPLTFTCLERNLANYLHVECYNAGLSDVAAKAHVSSDPNWGGVYLQEGRTDSVEDTTTKTLDSFKLKQCALIKIDAEGYEVKVLRGARETIKRCKPVLVIEVNKGALERQGTNEAELREMLDSLGYEIFKDSLGLQFDIFCRPKS